ncbi:hypothetical protein EUTSA_v10026078mg [Eutrema salsugineum]|uniref:Glabrous enhancer-binding protein-like DBD domain-containing protein n=1 Tax=Eutrema salsugineum TaxID=72664 RepID=V4MLB7_EUTSA|nr:hypothetical protein EUTSA_v10026078mg [Eutrema salsugineum]
MAKKLNPLEDPPTSSSSDEEEVETLSREEEEEEEEVEEEISDDSSSEEEDELMSPVKIPSRKKPKPPSAAVTIAVPGRLSITSGSESSPSKPTEKEVRGSPAIKSGKKRPDEKNSTEVSAKRARKVSEETEKQIVEATKKPLFQRLWTEEDEISLLQGMNDYEADKGYSPYVDMDGFYELALKSISFQASKKQFRDKISFLKKRRLTLCERWALSLLKHLKNKALGIYRFIGFNGEGEAKPLSSNLGIS